MWVNAVSTRGDEFKLNLGVALSIDEYPDRFEINYPGEEGMYKVNKTPEMVEAYNSLVPVKSQPVVPAEPFRITGLGVYEMESGDHTRITNFDDDDPNAPWCSEQGFWYRMDGEYFGDCMSKKRIVKLIKLDEVQP